MTATSKAHRDRLFLLRKGWGNDGWSAPPCMFITKKIEKQVNDLVKLGLLEPDEWGTSMYRITPRGKLALKEHFK